jgi:hypothetical protein
MPAKSKAQQRFFGMVRAAQKGEGASSPEVAKVADEISNKDAKKFAKTKHKGLPEVKEDKLAESDVPRNSMGKPIRIKDKIKAAKGFIPHKGKPTVDEGVGRAAIGAGVGAMVGGPVGAAAGAAIGASLGKKKVSSGAGGKKKLTNFFKAEPKVTRRESVEMKESVLDLVRKYGKKKKEKQPQKAMDAGARAKRKLARREYRSKVGATVPKELEDQKNWLDFSSHFHI